MCGKAEGADIPDIPESPDIPDFPERLPHGKMLLCEVAVEVVGDFLVAHESDAVAE